MSRSRLERWETHDCPVCAVPCSHCSFAYTNFTDRPYPQLKTGVHNCQANTDMPAPTRVEGQAAEDNMIISSCFFYLRPISTASLDLHLAALTPLESDDFNEIADGSRID